MIRLGILFEPDSPHADGYLHAAAALNNVTEIAITDPTGIYLPRARKQPGADSKQWTSFNTPAELLAKQKPELVIASAAAYRTPPLVAQALEANAHVLAEKPGCVRIADFERLARTADSKHRHIMLAVANRSVPLVRRAHELVSQGAIGTPYAAHVMVVADQTRLKRPEYQKTWTASKAKAWGGYLTWLAIHYIDLIQYLTGDRFHRAAAMIANANHLPMDVEDSVAASLSMSKGLLATVHGGYYVDRGYQSGFHLWGNNGWLRFQLQGTAGPVLEWMTYSSGKPESQTYPVAPAYDLFVQDAARAAEANAAPPITTAESLHLLRTVDAAYRAAASGAYQTIA